eukprot:GHUV01028678.1.p1 GENE.GHUV01028678.1~~GHUV01028678.1.p1  ORF type:complete len:116 (-),score=5.22 GHUV01028678.1:65-412(-)
MHPPPIILQFHVCYLLTTLVLLNQLSHLQHSNRTMLFAASMQTLEWKLIQQVHVHDVAAVIIEPTGLPLLLQALNPNLFSLFSCNCTAGCLQTPKLNCTHATIFQHYCTMLCACY